MNNDLKKVLQDLNRKKTKKAQGGIDISIFNDGLANIRGIDGYSPVKGIDYLTQSEVNEIVSGIFKAAKPEKGVDYYTDSEKRAFIGEVLKLATPIKGVHYRDGIDGRNGIDGKNVDEIDARKVAIDAINFLETFEGDARLSAKALKDLDEAVTAILEKGAEFAFTESQVNTIKDLLPKYPPINAGGSGATFLKSLRDVDLSNLTKNAEGKYILGGGAGGGHTIQDEGTPLTQRTNLNFVGAGVTVTDDAGNDATVVTITSGGGSGDVVGPASSIDNAIARFDSTTGKLIQNSAVLLEDDGSFENVNSIRLDTTYTGTPVEGEIFWDSTEKTISVRSGLDDVTLQVGREHHLYATNVTGSTLLNGKAVYVTGASGINPTVAYAQANDYTKTNKTIGVLTMDIANAASGLVTTYGLVHDLNTSGFAAGDVLYLDNSVSGGITNTNPTGINYTLRLGLCITSNASTGIILVDPKGLVAFESDEFKVVDSTDKTKQMTFNVSGITPGTKRVYTVPNQDVDLVGTITSQTLTNKTIALGTNTISGTKNQFDAACTDGDFVFTSDITELSQDAVGAMVGTSIVYNDAGATLQRAALTGAITASQDSNTTSLGSFTKAQLDTAVNDGNVLYVGDVTTNATHTGEVTGSGALTVDKTAISNRTDTVITASDYIIFGDASDTDNLKKDTVQGILDLVTGGSNTYFNDIFIDQSGGTSDTYGVLAGTINGSNAVFTVSQSVYATGTLQVWLNGQLLTQGTGEDWTETTPASGTFTFNTAPATGSLITAEYQKVTTSSATVMYGRQIINTSVSATVGSTANTDYVYFITAAHTMSLPSAAGNTNRYTFKNNHSADVTIDTVGAETIDGTASITIAPESSVDIISNGTNFYII